MGAVTVYRVIHLGVTVTVVRYTETQYSSLANNHTSLVAHHRTSETQPKSKLLTTTAYKLPELGNIQRTSSTEMCHQGFPNFSFPIFNRSGFRRGLAGSGSASSTSSISGSSYSNIDPQVSPNSLSGSQRGSSKIAATRSGSCMSSLSSDTHSFTLCPAPDRRHT